jgi:hypothetical protein
MGMWIEPNVGATNSSGFTALPAGEYDAHEFMKFQLIHQYGVFWTATEVSTELAKEKYLSAGSAASMPYNWYKIMKYSVRCVKDLSTGLEEGSKIEDEILHQTVVNQFLLLNPKSCSAVERLEIYDLNGRLVMSRNGVDSGDKINVSALQKGIYIVRLIGDNKVATRRILKT